MTTENAAAIVLTTLRRSTEPLCLRAICARSGLTPATVAAALARLIADDRVDYKTIRAAALKCGVRFYFSLDNELEGNHGRE